MERPSAGAIFGRRNSGKIELSGIDREHKTQEQWEWPIAVYLYLAGMGAGAFAAGLLTTWLLPGKVSPGMLLWGPFLVALGAPFLVLDLGKKTRFINACLNPRTSWASRGFAILSTLIVLGIVIFVVETPSIGIPLPHWLTLPLTRRILEVAGLVLSLGTAVYTGIFLKSVKTVSLWNTWSLPALFLSSALTTGAFALGGALSVAGVITADPTVARVAGYILVAGSMLIVIEGVALTSLLRSLRRNPDVTFEEVLHLAFKSSPSLVAGLAAVGVSFLVPASRSVPLHLALVGLAVVSILAGGLMLRFDLVTAGRRNEHPLRKMALQSNWSKLSAWGDDQVLAVVPAEMTPILEAAKRHERPLLEVAFSLFRTGSDELSRSKVRVMAVLYRSWRRPLRVEYAIVTDGI